MEEEILEYIGNFNRAPFLFIGSGISRRYLNIEDWEGLLKKFSESIGIDFQYYMSSAEQNLPSVATSLAVDFHEIWWKDTKYEKSRKKYKDICTDKESALKIEISHYIKRCISNLTEDKDLREEIKLLQNGIIDGVITTNWDNLLESIFSDFKTYVGQNELIFSSPQGIGEIYKIHGCSSQPNSLILTSRDYENFESRNPYLAAKLLTIFTEHPVIFIGYSLSDENILKILESISSCLTSENIKKLQDRLIFIQWETSIKGANFSNDTISVNGKRIPVKTITVPNYKSLFKALTRIERKFPARMLRQLKEHVYELVLSNDKSSKLYVQSIDDANQNIADLEVVFGVGAINKVAGAGYKSIGRKELIDNLIHENKPLDNSKVISVTLPELLKNTKHTPFFKFLSESNLIKDQNLTNIKDERIIKHFNESKKIEHYYPTLSSYLKKKDEIFNERLSLYEFIRKYDFLYFLKVFAFIDKELFNCSELLNLINENIETMNSNNTSDKSNFFRLICYYDYCKYYLCKI